MAPVHGAPQSIRRLGTEGIRIRIITHRLFIRWFHEIAVAQTVRWLDNHGIPYWDLCFMRDKEAVEADLYVEDSPINISRLVEQDRKLIVFGNSANAAELPDSECVLARVTDWSEAEELIRTTYYAWLQEEGADLPPGIGQRAPWYDML
jgi:5' nucleotidase, deoxy (Pyrimidine), cytosolic type C protein (NT5C)